MVNGECIGWTIEQDYGFSPAISDITSKIIKQNQQVAQRGTRYARIAVLMPMTGNDTTVMPESTIINALRVSIRRSRARTIQTITPWAAPHSRFRWFWPMGVKQPINGDR
jgi:hypothetical protein